MEILVFLVYLFSAIGYDADRAECPEQKKKREREDLIDGVKGASCCLGAFLVLAGIVVGLIYLGICIGRK